MRFKKKDLQNSEFVSQNSEAQLATHIFGTDKTIGTAKISMDIINSSEWQEKRNLQVKEFEKKGIVIDENNKCIEWYKIKVVSMTTFIFLLPYYCTITVLIICKIAKMQ